MRRNVRSSTKFSRTAHWTIGGVVVVIALLVASLVRMRAESTCQDLRRTIVEKERELAKLNDSLVRESARWEEMTTPEKLEQALVRHGLSMRYPRPSQMIRMTADGRPYPNQLSVAKAEQRASLRATASYRGTRR